MERKLSEAVYQLVCLNRDEWDSYVPRPLDFVRDNRSPRFGIDESMIEANLDYLIERLDEDGLIRPRWAWNAYPDEWKMAEREWTGRLTLLALMTLQRFDRIDVK